MTGSVSPDNHSLTGAAIWLTPGIPFQAIRPSGLAMFRIDFNKLRFLVCDDNPHMRRILRTLLHSFGVREVHESENGATALELYSHYIPDIVITDWSMPILDGLELAQMIRQPESASNPYVPIIMLTGHSEKRRVTVARDAGVTEFLAKPISAKALYQRILNVVANPRPFIKTKTYFGPDRRRNTGNTYMGPERRVGGEVEVLMKLPSLLDKARATV
jgi:two-component system, chemotaxis family, chemotaxis protein CheY